MSKLHVKRLKVKGARKHIINSVEKCSLKNDSDKHHPACTFDDLDSDTVEEIEDKLSSRLYFSNIEIYVANMLVELSKKENKHIGFFLFDDDKKRLYDEIGINTKVNTGLSGATKLLLYTFGIYLPSIILSIVLFKEKFLWGIIPFSEVF